MTHSTSYDVVRSARLPALLAALLFGAAPALAAPADPAAADALFKSARALVEKGDWAAGCPKFEASLALNPSASTALNIAKCHEHDGKIATAWEDYRSALVLNRETKGAARQRELEAIAKEGVSALEARLPRLRIVIQSPPAGLKVLRDNTEILAAALGEALPLDPGRHEVQASAPGYQAETRSVTAEEGKTTTLEIALKAAAPRAPSPRPRDGTARGGVPAWAWVTGALGLALGGVAAFFLADDLSAVSALRRNCTTDKTGTSCVPGYDYAHDNGRKNRGFGLFVGLGSASVIAIGAAVVGIVRAPPRTTGTPTSAMMAAPWVGQRSAGAMISGRF